MADLLERILRRHPRHLSWTLETMADEEVAAAQRQRLLHNWVKALESALKRPGFGRFRAGVKWAEPTTE